MSRMSKSRGAHWRAPVREAARLLPEVRSPTCASGAFALGLDEIPEIRRRFPIPSPHDSLPLLFADPAYRRGGPLSKTSRCCRESSMDPPGALVNSINAGIPDQSQGLDNTSAEAH